MKVTSIDRSPNPNALKFNLQESSGVSMETYVPGRIENAPERLHPLLNVEGVQSVFVTPDWISVNKDPAVSWEQIVPRAVEALGGAAEGAALPGF